MTKKKVQTFVLNLVRLLAFPVGAWLLMEVLCLLFADRHLLNTILDIRNYVRTVGIATCTALALSFNLASGRFDLSLGAQRMMATIIGANIAIQLGFGPVGMVVTVFLVGLLAGGIVGAVFVTSRVPPMVLGVGMTMIYECVAFISSNGEGLNLFGKGYDALAQLGFITVVIIMACLFIMFLMQYTRFGYEMRAIRGSQSIAYNSGINIFAHVALCYTLAGGMASFSGLFNAAFEGSMKASMGMSSNGPVMSCCFPMFLGGFLSRWCNQPVGILFATMTLKMIENGMTALNLTSTASQAINMGLFLLFLIIRANEYLPSQKKADEARRNLARKKAAAATI